MDMSRRGWRRALLCALLLFALACQIWTAFARAALNAVSLPAMAALHRLTARFPFPVAEPAALVLIALPLPGLIRVVLRKQPLRRWLDALAAGGLLIAGALILLWAPACAMPADPVPEPGATQLAWLCESLIESLNDAPLAFPAPADALARAPLAAGLPDCAVKAARYPEWMDLIHAWGLFVPLTGEALVDAGEPAPLLPFTAVHELSHLSGIADEGAANVAAWNRCLAAGGAFADSARLWALRYAMGLLRREDEAAWLRASKNMKDALLRVYRDCGGEAGPGHPRSVSLIRGDYAALACYLSCAAP